MKNFLTGKQASIHDRLAPMLVDEDGTPLPIPAFHALDVNTRDDWNLLNPAGGIHAVELESDELEDSPWDDKAEVLGFEDMFVSDPEYRGRLRRPGGRRQPHRIARQPHRERGGGSRPCCRGNLGDVMAWLASAGTPRRRSPSAAATDPAAHEDPDRRR